MGLATDAGDKIIVPHSTIGVLERQEVERVGRQMAAEWGFGRKRQFGLSL